MRILSFVVAVVASMLMVPSAAAVLVEMPLAVEPDKQSVNAGDEIRFTVTLLNESWRERLAGRTLRVEFTHDGATEGEQMEVGVVGDVTLDDAAAGTFAWTVPESVDDENVFVTVMDGEEGVGSAHVAVGDAPPIMFATGGAPPEGGTIPDESGGEPADDATTERDVPAGGAALVLLGTLGAAVALVARRSR